MQSKEVLLEKFCEWLFKQGRNDDTAADDEKGRRVSRSNPAWNKNGERIWFLPGTWGKVNLTEPRELTLKSGDQIFVVVASSHATPDDLPASPPANEARLKAHAQKIDKLWLNPTLHIVHPDGSEENIQSFGSLVTTGMLELKVDPNNGYAILTGVHGNKVKIVTAARVHIFTPKSGKTLLTIAAMSRADPNCGEKGETEYNVHASYIIKVP